MSKLSTRVSICIALLFIVVLSISILGLYSKEVTFKTSQSPATYYIGSLLTPIPAYASVDYQCDGVDDNVQLQLALDALPTEGGKIVIYAGNYHLTATVSRAIDNIVIEGVGAGTYLANNGITSIYSVGVQKRWIFKDIRVDNGGIAVATSTEWSFDNVWIGNTYVSKRADFTTTLPDDMANKDYVDTHGGTGNITGSGTAGRLTKFDGPSSIANASNTDSQVSNAVAASHIQNTDTSLGIQSSSLIMGGSNITNVGYVDGVDISALAASAGNVTTLGFTPSYIPVANSDSSLVNSVVTSNATGIYVTGNIDLTQNITLATGKTVDGVDISTLSSGSGNVTTPGFTSGYFTLANSTTSIVDSIMTSNGTLVSIPIVTGAELCPTIAAANWTGGAGWTVGVGTLTRVASAITTAYPTVAITPTAGLDYLVTFTISSWTAGTVTMTLGGVVSTPLQGNQNVYLYVTPYTTGSLIFTPDSSFAGVISLASVKAYTGGEIYLGAGALYYDSRGHPNRLSHVTRHLSEMQTDTLLDKSRSTLTCSGGVLTYTLYAVYGSGTWNFNGIVYPLPVASANVSLVGGTDYAPKTNWVYFYLNGNTPTLAVTTTGEPTVSPNIMVAEFIVGSVSGSSYTIYGYNRARTEVDSFVKRVIGRFENSGSLYVEGGLPTVNSTTLSVASGSKWYQGIFEMTANNTVVAPTSFFYLFSNGTYIPATSLSALSWYSDGTALGSNERQNIVWGIVPTTTTASGTLPTTVKLVAVLQSKPTSVYISDTTAEQDIYEATNYYPPDAQLKEVFLPIARTIVRPSVPSFQLFGSGTYYRDLRGRVLYGGGAATSTDTSVFLLLDGTRPMTGSLNMGTAGNITMAEGMTVDGVDVSNIGTTSITFLIDGGGAAISTGVKGDLEIPFNCTIDRATALADQSGNVTISIWKSSYAGFAPTASANITASSPVTITSAIKSQDSTLSGWTKTITAGDILRFNVDSCAVITRVTVSLRATK